MKLVFALVLLVCPILGSAQSAASQDLPTSLKGRWRFAVDGSTQVFSLEDIRSQPDKTFTAKLTWWQVNPWCATRDLPIVGRETESGITFDVPKKCNIWYQVEMRRDGSGWVGTATNTMRGFGLELDLKAN